MSSASLQLVASAPSAIPTAEALLAPLHIQSLTSPELEASIVGSFISPNAQGRMYDIPRFRFAGPDAHHQPVKLALFAGVHGDEPAGCAALVEFLSGLVQEPSRAAGYELWVYPIVNPTGYEDGTRANRAGKDLNREFWHNTLQPEVRILEQELIAQQFHGLITLHADDTCEGHYGYSHGCPMTDSLLRPALLAAEKVLPRDNRATIDGFAAREGVICDCFHGILSAPGDQQPRPFNVIFETPANLPQALQIAANVAALDAILATYRGFIAYAQDL